MKKKRIISILAKAPMPKGRIGPHHKQDWHASCITLAEELNRDKHALALIVTNLKLDGMDEMAHYHGTLRKLGVCEKRILCRYEGLETIHQIEKSAEEAENLGRELVFVLTDIHFVRAKLFCYILGIKATFIVAHGIPRPKDIVSEVLLLPIYPLFFSRKFRKRFQSLAQNRRLNGKL